MEEQKKRGKKSSFDFEKFFEALLEYKSINGDLQVPISTDLGRTVRRIRGGKLLLSAEEKKRLDEIGFIWVARKPFVFEEFFSELKIFIEKNGNLLVPEAEALGKTVNRVRCGYIPLTSEQKRKLEGLGFVWNVRNTKFEMLCEELREYKREHGDLLVPFSYPKLGPKVKHIRNGETVLSQEQKDVLTEMGFVWKARQRDYNFDDFYQKLLEFKAEHGHLLIPQSCRLGRQVGSVRRGIIKTTDEQKAMLNKIGFVWNARSINFDELYKELKKYKKEHGDLMVPQKGSALGQKVAHIRSGVIKLSPEQEKKIDKLGFIWKVHSRKYKFPEFYQSLIKFKEEHGHLLIPQSLRPLGTYVSQIRAGVKKLTTEQRKMLDDLGFVWDATKRFDFNGFVKNLIDYKKEHDDLRVPQASPLGQQVAYVRQNKKYFSDEQLQILDDLNFVWNTRSTDFDKFINALLKYKKEHGDLLVPYGYIKNKSLGLRVHNTRIRKEKLTEEQIERLDEIGFVWKVLYQNKIKDFDYQTFIKHLSTYKASCNDKIIAFDVVVNNYELGFYARNIRTGNIELTKEQKEKLKECEFLFDTSSCFSEKTDDDTTLLERMLKGDMTARCKIMERYYKLVDCAIFREHANKSEVKSFATEQFIHAIDRFPSNRTEDTTLKNFVNYVLRCMSKQILSYHSKKIKNCKFIDPFWEKSRRNA